MASVLGLDAKLYRNTGTYASPTWNEITNIKDVTLNLTKGEANVSIRGSSFRLRKGTLKDASIDFNLLWDTDDEDFTAIQEAFFDGTTIEILAVDQAYNTVGSQGLRATVEVFTFTRNENLEEALNVDVSLKPTYATNLPEWYTYSS